MRGKATILAGLLAATAAAQSPPATAPAPPPSTAVPAAAPPAPAATQAPLDGGPTFISPMGEPFRSDDKLSGAEHWFAAADTNHDGRLTLAEFKLDADRFFKTLDTDHDGEIGPDEIDRYETVVAPEIRVASTYGDATKASTDSDGNVKEPPYPTRLGAGRYGYLDMPEPVVAADLNLDRAVTRREFQTAAERRFALLDTNHDGAITRDELPRLTPVAEDRRKKRRR